MAPASARRAACSALGFSPNVEPGSGVAAGYPDEAYVAKGAKLAANRAEAFAADIVCQVRSLGANPVEGQADLDFLRPGQVLIGMADPLSAVDGEAASAARLRTV